MDVPPHTKSFPNLTLTSLVPRGLSKVLWAHIPPGSLSHGFMFVIGSHVAAAAVPSSKQLSVGSDLGETSLKNQGGDQHLPRIQANAKTDANGSNSLDPGLVCGIYPGKDGTSPTLLCRSSAVHPIRWLARQPSSFVTPSYPRPSKTSPGMPSIRYMQNRTLPPELRANSIFEIMG